MSRLVKALPFLAWLSEQEQEAALELATVNGCNDVSELRSFFTLVRRGWIDPDRCITGSIQ